MMEFNPLPSTMNERDVKVTRVTILALAVGGVVETTSFALARNRESAIASGAATGALLLSAFAVGARRRV